MGKFARRNTKRKTPFERNTPMIGRMIEARHGKATANGAGLTAARRIAGEEGNWEYLHERLPRELTLLESKQCLPDQDPKCDTCPIKKLCTTWRSQQKGPRLREPPSILEFFCGAGGMSLGFEQAGFRTVFALDADQDAIHTYHANRPWMTAEQVKCLDIRDLDDTTLKGFRGKVDGIVGGPPCQTFSMVGYRTKKKKNDEGDVVGHQPTWRKELITGDHRTWLPGEMARIIALVRPKFCVMENVGGFMTALNGKVREETLETIRKAGYSIAEVKVHADRHGVPQKRLRYLLVGFYKRGFGGEVGAQVMADEVKAILEHRTARDISVSKALKALAPFGELEPGAGDEYLLAQNGHETWNHYARAHNPTDLKIYKELKPGETARDLEARKPNSIHYDLSSFGDKYRKLNPRRPSPTIPAHLKKDSNSFILDGVNRGITPREAATLQGFPLDYIFVGEQSAQYQQVGNAVPPPMAKTVAQLIRAALHDPDEVTVLRRRYERLFKDKRKRHRSKVHDRKKTG